MGPREPPARAALAARSVSPRWTRLPGPQPAQPLPALPLSQRSQQSLGEPDRATDRGCRLEFSSCRQNQIRG